MRAKIKPGVSQVQGLLADPRFAFSKFGPTDSREIIITCNVVLNTILGKMTLYLALSANMFPVLDVFL